MGWGNDVDDMHRTPLDYWMLSFPSHMLTDIRNWTSDRLLEVCEKVIEGEILAVFGALYSLTRTLEGRRDLLSTEGEILAVFGALYSLTRTLKGRRDLWSVALRMDFFRPLVLGSDIARYKIALKFYLDLYHSVLKNRASVINGHLFAFGLKALTINEE